MYNFKWINIIFVVLLFSSFVFANDVIINEPPVPTKTTTIIQENPEIIQGLVEVRANIQELNQRINTLPTEEKVLQFLNNQVILQNQALEEHRSTMIISQIIINICFLVLAFAIFFYYKGKGRV